MASNATGIPVAKIRRLITELREEEEEARYRGNEPFAQGVAYARINLETLIEDCGYRRPASLESNQAHPERTISSQT